MFLIFDNKEKCQNAIEFFKTSLHEISFGPTHYIKLGNYYLGWTRCKQHENLHVFDGTYFIGKLSFSEVANPNPIFHNNPFDVAIIPPLTIGVIIRSDHNKLLIEPFSITNVFYSDRAVSDMQLLIAKAEELLPSHEGVAVLSAVGYFPGNITLFAEIKKIPFLVKYELRSHQLSDQPTLPYQQADDGRMIERLKMIAPDHPHQYVSMSGGYDSRFVLGVLKQNGISPHLMHIGNEETAFVQNIAELLNLPVTVVNAPDFVALSPETYTLATDAQIYFRGGNYSGVRNEIKRESVYHFGLFADSILKNAFKTAIKIPGRTGSIIGKLIDHAILSNCPVTIEGLRESNTRQIIKQYLDKELEFGNEYCCFRTKKEWANWFYYLHRGLRWSISTTSDMSYFTHPVFILSDIEALMVGISSTAWCNYKKDRVRGLNANLLPDLTVDYNDGGSYLINNGMVNDWRRIKYEYLERLGKYLQGRRETKKAREKHSIFTNIKLDAEEFSQYFSTDLLSLTQSSSYSYSLKRAAVTISYALKFLCS